MGFFSVLSIEVAACIIFNIIFAKISKVYQNVVLYAPYYVMVYDVEDYVFSISTLTIRYSLNVLMNFLSYPRRFCCSLVWWLKSNYVWNNMESLPIRRFMP
jgi:hypothetical protein